MSENDIVEINDPSQARAFHTEDIVYMNVPVGRVTYGFKRMNRDHLESVESIGRFCSIAKGASVAGFHHPMDWVSTNPFLYRSDRRLISKDREIPESTRLKNKKVLIGHDVWIGENVKILRPCVIGHGSVLAAGCVVTRDVPPYAVVGGVPAKILKWRIPEDLIKPMLEIAWWNWELKKIKRYSEDFYEPKSFVKKHLPD